MPCVKCRMLLDLKKSFQFWLMCVWSVEGASNVYPIFVLDPWFLAPDPTAPSPGSKLVGINRIRFLLQSLQNLDDNLRQHGSRLLLMNGNPTTVIPELLEKVSFYTARFCTSCQWSFEWGDSWWYFLISFVSTFVTRVLDGLNCSGTSMSFAMNLIPSPMPRIGMPLSRSVLNLSWAQISQRTRIS